MKQLFSDKRVWAAFAVFVIVVCLSVWQTLIYVWASRTLEGAVVWSDTCIKNERDVICGVLKGTKENVDSYVEQMIWPISSVFKNTGSYKHLNDDLWPKVEPHLAYSEARSKQLYQEIAEAKAFKDKIDKAQRQQAAEAEVDAEKFRGEYDQLGAPKLLYKCDGRLFMVAGRSKLSNYNSIYLEAKQGCVGDFAVLDSEK